MNLLDHYDQKCVVIEMVFFRIYILWYEMMIYVIRIIIRIIMIYKLSWKLLVLNEMTYSFKWLWINNLDLSFYFPWSRGSNRFFPTKEYYESIDEFTVCVFVCVQLWLAINQKLFVDDYKIRT